MIQFLVAPHLGGEVADVITTGHGKDLRARRSTRMFERRGCVPFAAKPQRLVRNLEHRAVRFVLCLLAVLDLLPCESDLVLSSRRLPFGSICSLFGALGLRDGDNCCDKGHDSRGHGSPVAAAHAAPLVTRDSLTTQ